MFSRYTKRKESEVSIQNIEKKKEKKLKYRRKNKNYFKANKKRSKTHINKKIRK